MSLTRLTETFVSTMVEVSMLNRADLGAVGNLRGRVTQTGLTGYSLEITAEVPVDETVGDVFASIGVPDSPQWETGSAILSIEELASFD
jgi:hypothetical protein